MGLSLTETEARNQPLANASPPTFCPVFLNSPSSDSALDLRYASGVESPKFVHPGGGRMSPAGAPPRDREPQSSRRVSRVALRSPFADSRHEQGPTATSLRQVRPPPPPPRPEPRPRETPAHPHAVGAVLGGARRAARPPGASPGLLVVPSQTPFGTAPLGLFRAAVGHLPLPRLPRTSPTAWSTAGRPPNRRAPLTASLASRAELLVPRRTASAPRSRPGSAAAQAEPRYSS